MPKESDHHGGSWNSQALDGLVRAAANNLEIIPSIVEDEELVYFDDIDAGRLEGPDRGAGLVDLEWSV